MGGRRRRTPCPRAARRRRIKGSVDGPSRHVQYTVQTGEPRSALKPFSLSNGALLTRVPGFCQRRFLLRSQSVGDVPRSGWSTVDVPTGWVQVLRGPRPHSETWPTVQKAVGRWRKEKPSKSTPPKPGSVPTAEYKPSRAPEVAVADAVAEVKRLEAAIEVLGGDTCMQKVSRKHCGAHEPGPECFQSQSEWQHGRRSSNGPRNGSSELKR